MQYPTEFLGSQAVATSSVTGVGALYRRCIVRVFTHRCLQTWTVQAVDGQVARDLHNDALSKFEDLQASCHWPTLWGKSDGAIPGPLL